MSPDSEEESNVGPRTECYCGSCHLWRRPGTCPILPPHMYSGPELESWDEEDPLCQWLTDHSWLGHGKGNFGKDTNTMNASSSSSSGVGNKGKDTTGKGRDAGKGKDATAKGKDATSKGKDDTEGKDTGGSQGTKRDRSGDHTD